MPSQLFLKPEDRKVTMQRWKEDTLKALMSMGRYRFHDNIDDPRVEKLSSASSKAISTVVNSVMQCVKEESCHRR